jgi:hypothetical protein
MPRPRARSSRLLRRAAWTACAIALLLVATRSNRAQSNELNLQFHTFQDTRGVTVLSPTADLSTDFTERTTLRMNFGVDAISAASDSCARCHREGVRSRRQAGGLSVTEKFDDWKLTVGGEFSKENFYRATTGLASISRDLNKGSTTVAGGFSFSLNQPTLHPLQQIENQYQRDVYATVTQTLTKTTIVQAGYQLSSMSGYLNNPFLRTSVNGVMTLGQVPGTRLRQTFSARVRQALPADTYLEVDFRHYRDDWQVGSNAINLGVSHDITPQMLGSFSYRAYTQTGAYFYQPSYVGAAPQFYTGDFRLEPFTSGLFTGKLAFTPKTRHFGLPDGAAWTLQYERYRTDNGFQAGIFSAGLRIPLGTK